MKAVRAAWPIPSEEHSEWWHPQTAAFPWHQSASREPEVKTASFPSFLSTPEPRCGISWGGSAPLLLHQGGENPKPRQDKLSKASTALQTWISSVLSRK